MNYVLDTCVISELVKPRPAAKVVEWLGSIPAEQLFLSALTVGEIKRGMMMLPESKKKTRLISWFETLLTDYHDRIVPVDLAVAEAWGTLQARAEAAGQKMPIIDGYIAATASAYRMVIVTRNEEDFEGCHQDLVNPWKLL
ncbi:MAG: type II toxin-antitoxin system VapC family toxin [Deltaproteobacteria bacterium]|nr:type II toxin-antitoxin system VapC family toxin [Deltaproteobacteria bacterium]